MLIRWWTSFSLRHFLIFRSTSVFRESVSATADLVVVYILCQLYLPPGAFIYNQPKVAEKTLNIAAFWYHVIPLCGGKFWIAHFSASSNFLNGICHCPLQWSNTAQCLGSVVSSSAGNGQVGFFPFCFDTKGIPVHQGDSHLPLGEARVSSFYLVSANDYTLFVVLHFVIYSQF